MRATLLGHRLVFAALITYMATQAHGWAGGLATRPSVTVLTWLGVTLATCLLQSRWALLAIALGTQLGIHFGTSGVHTHCEMQMSMNQMTLGHLISGTLAWFLLILSEQAFLLAVEVFNVVVARLVGFANVVCTELPIIPGNFDSKTIFENNFLLQVFERRGPPIFSM